jgi:hypothetical protein
MLNLVVGLLVALLALPAPLVFAADTTVVGSGIADATGKGNINVNVNAALDPHAVADDVRSNVELTNDAKPDLVEPDPVQEGSVRIAFSDAPPGSTVEALLSEDARRRIMGLAAVGGGGMPAGAIAGVAAVLVTGGVLGGLAAAGKFSGTSEKPATLSQ